MDALREVLVPEPTVEAEGVTAWWRLVCGSAGGESWDVAIRGGARADRMGYAFVAGYEAALARLLPPHDRARTAALCVTENGPPHPRSIATRVDRGALSGDKSFVTLGTDAEDLYVLAREASDDVERSSLVLVRVERQARGVDVRSMPPLGFVPEVPHATVRLREVRDFERLPGDGWTEYVRPFRTVEDIHVHAAVLAFAVAESVRWSLAATLVERGAATLLALRALSTADPSSPVVHVALAGAIHACRAWLADFEPPWLAAVGEEMRARWERDRPLLQIAERAREQRLARAWQRLGE